MIIAHDLGTTGNKASLHDDDGRLLAAVTVRYGSNFASGGVAEQNPEDWWEAVVAATRKLLAHDGADALAVTAIGISGQMMGAVYLDEDYRPVVPSMIWADTRSTEQCDRLVEAVGMERGYAITGHRLNPTYSISKVMWLADRRPDEFRRVRHICLAKDFVVHRLTGRLLTDPSDASSTNAFDQLAGEWSDEILDAAGVARELFPEIVPSTEVVGALRPDAADALGLSTSTVVVMGGGDGPMAALGTGIVAPEDGAYAYLGTSSWVSMSADRPLHDPLMRTMSFTHVVPGRYVPTATMQAGGGSLQWIAELLEPDADGSTFDRLVGDASTASASGDGLYFLPHLLGERSPYWDPDARGAFVGLARHHDRSHLVRAVLEGVAFNLLTCVDAFREAGAPVDRVDAIGGGANSDAWLQLMADMWGATVRRRTIVDEGNSLGAAVVAGVGAGVIADLGASRSLSEVTAEFQPDPARRAEYRARHDAFLDAYRTLEPWNAARAADRAAESAR
ncbi:xylulokinase [Agromyces protaetiae]|uniref:Xylulose kinase n=1 Tax=Agromyces protaetiae TaxID=2509455 RepID=A0A4P6FGX6_9MICO|nr:xylulokinase [Agromyces protaetiae]QAY73739.1 xylulokinase [Agromyces protaetiae]